jgi:hypothetical protein
MLRETVFVLGGALLVAVGAVYFASLAAAGVGWDGLYLYLSTAVGVGFGAFFVYVGRAERSARRAFLERENSALPP